VALVCRVNGVRNRRYLIPQLTSNQSPADGGIGGDGERERERESVVVKSTAGDDGGAESGA